MRFFSLLKYLFICLRKLFLLFSTLKMYGKVKYLMNFWHFITKNFLLFSFAVSGTKDLLDSDEVFALFRFLFIHFCVWFNLRWKSSKYGSKINKCPSRFAQYLYRKAALKSCRQIGILTKQRNKRRKWQEDEWTYV